ncbi:MAG TPA: hypothetical protein VFI17_05925 [Solirubrobacterales bacterium]|nr:hypothetical protein [Solirubrobacterales bacterium]
MERARSLGAAAGNEILTCAIASVLTILLLVEGVTILDLGPLLVPHMLVGLALIPLVVAKLATTGYRFARYYTRSPVYREKGPPLLPLRLLAPVLVVGTLGVFATGVALLVDGRKSDTLLFFHKATFVVWGAAFGIHLLAYLPRVLRSLRADWTARRRRLVGGAGLRGTVVGVAFGSGLVLALALLPTIDAWQDALVG